MPNVPASRSGRQLEPNSSEVNEKAYDSGFLQVPSTDTATTSDSGAVSSAASSGCSEASADSQQGRGRISQAEAGLTLEDISAPAEAVQFQAEIISSIDKVRRLHLKSKHISSLNLYTCHKSSSTFFKPCV